MYPQTVGMDGREALLRVMGGVNREWRSHLGFLDVLSRPFLFRPVFLSLLPLFSCLPFFMSSWHCCFSSSISVTTPFLIVLLVSKVAASRRVKGNGD